MSHTTSAHRAEDARAGSRARQLASSVAATVGLLIGLAARVGAQSEGARDRPATPDTFFDYLYAEPNSGSASGGHVAIRFGDDVYHFQQVEGGILRIFRVDAARFDHSYRALGNRSLRVIRVPVSGAAFERLQWAFESYRLRQDAEFERLDGLRVDRELLDRWTSSLDAPREPPAIVTSVPASGYFDLSAVTDQSGPDHSTRSQPIERVARRVEALAGPGFLERRRRELESEIGTLEPATVGPGIARRLTDLTSEWLALGVLASGPPIAAGTWISLDEPEWRLTPDEVATLRDLARRQEDAAVDLTRSERTDRGFPLLVALARLDALERSIEGGRLVVLDPARGDEASVPAEDVRASAAALRRILDERREDFHAARAALWSQGAWDEGRLSRLELASNAWADLERALDANEALRVPPAAQLPNRVAAHANWPLPTVPSASIRVARERAGARESEAHAALLARYPYDLVRRNCVTEVFRVLDTVPLGGHVDPDGTLTFVPLASSYLVESSYPATGVEGRLSYRATALERLATCDGRLAASLAESTTVSSPSYTLNDADPLFLFFTDETTVARPALGALNLAVGAGGAVAGALAAPWDGGTLLRRGWEGVLFSLPELGFVSLRRGTIRFAPLSWERDLGAICASPTSSSPG